MKEKTKSNIKGLLSQLRATHKYFNGREIAAIIEQALEPENEIEEQELSINENAIDIMNRFRLFNKRK